MFLLQNKTSNLLQKSWTFFCLDYEPLMIVIKTLVFCQIDEPQTSCMGRPVQDKPLIGLSLSDT